MTQRKARAELPQVSAQRPDGLSFDLPKNAVTRWNRALVPAAAAAEGEKVINILDFIGPEEWGGVSAKTIARALEGAADVVVNINSPGGDLFEGVAIYNLLREHKAGKVKVKVLGLAASAASIIAMAGDDVEIGRTAWMMIHNVWVLAIGNRNDLRKYADELEAFDGALAELYASRTGRTKRKMSQFMDAETWFDGSAAIDEGFADELLPADAVGRRKDGEGEGEDEEYASLASRIDASLIRGGIPRPERLTMMNQLRGALSARRQPTEDRMNEQQRQQEEQRRQQQDEQARQERERQAAAAGAPAAAQAARTRIRDILALPEAQGREKLANHFAFETDLTVEAVKASLAASPKATRMDDAMQSFRPAISSQEEGSRERPAISSPRDVYARMNKAYNEANLVKR